MAYTAEYWKYNAFCARYSCPTIVQEKIAETNDVRKWEGKPPLPPCGGGIDCFCSREKIGQDGKKVCCLCKYPIDPTDCYLNVLAKIPETISFHLVSATSMSSDLMISDGCPLKSSTAITGLTE